MLLRSTTSNLEFLCFINFFWLRNEVHIESRKPDVWPDDNDHGSQILWKIAKISVKTRSLSFKMVLICVTPIHLVYFLKYKTLFGLFK